MSTEKTAGDKLSYSDHPDGQSSEHCITNAHVEETRASAVTGPEVLVPEVDAGVKQDEDHAGRGREGVGEAGLCRESVQKTDVDKCQTDETMEASTVGPDKVNTCTAVGQNKTSETSGVEAGLRGEDLRERGGAVPKHRRQNFRPSNQKTSIPAANCRKVDEELDVLSNLYPCDLYVYGMDFWSTEQAYQWRKAMFMGNIVAANKIYDAEYARDVKRIADTYFRHQDMSRWVTQRVPIMRQLIRAKARCCKRFSKELCRTGDKFIIMNVSGDQYWAIGNGTGKNVMGKLLMELHSHLDEALSADPEKDGKMVHYPTHDTSDPFSYDDKPDVLLIGSSQPEISEPAPAEKSESTTTETGKREERVRAEKLIADSAHDEHKTEPRVMPGKPTEAGQTSDASSQFGVNGSSVVPIGNQYQNQTDPVGSGALGEREPSCCMDSESEAGIHNKTQREDEPSSGGIEAGNQSSEPNTAAAAADSGRGRMEKRPHKPREATYDDGGAVPKRRRQNFRPSNQKTSISAANCRKVDEELDVLSNFYPCDLYVYGMDFWSTEQAYQWRKAMFMGNEEAAHKIYDAKYARDAKRIANTYFRHKDLSKWVTQRVPVMRQLIRAKARCCEKFSNELRRTGDKVIIENVPGDQYWAIGNGSGKNVMGKLLMELRSHLDEALSADPDEDGKMVDYPTHDTSDPFSYDDKPAVLLIGSSQLNGINFGNLLQNTTIKCVVVSSAVEAQNVIQTENLCEYKAVILHLFSYELVRKSDKDQIQRDVMHLIDMIKQQVRELRIIVSLAIYPLLSKETDYAHKADSLNNRLRHSLTCRTNGFRLKLSECFQEDGSLYPKAQEMLQNNLRGTILHHLSKKGKNY